jgi:sugar-specific transcriptional regulator TrmB
MDDASLEGLLRRFGFSDKEIDTYLMILELGEAKAKTIADGANVSKRHVYSVAETLADRGFVEVNDHVVPTTIKANPPENVVGTLLDDLETMQPALESRFSQTAPRSESFKVVKSRVTVLKRVSELLSRAEIEVTLAIPYRLLDEVADELRDAFERDVLVLLLVTGVDPNQDLDIQGLASVARAWDQPMPTMLTVDRKMGLVAPPELLSQANSTEQAIVFAQEQLGPVIIGSFLGNYFPMATEVYVAEPRELPVAYTDFRHAVLQVALHARADTDVHAHVVGRFLYDEDGPTELDGAVVDFRQSLFEPTTSSFPVENTLTIETADGVYSVGGQGAFVEEFEASEVELRRAENHG